MAGRNTYDINSVQKEVLEHRAARRQLLRNEYLREVHNPYRMAAQQESFVGDIAINRFQSMRASFSEFFKPTPKNSAFLLGVTIIPIIVLTYILKVTRDASEAKLRRGEVSYRDRDYKFK